MNSNQKIIPQLGGRQGPIDYPPIRNPLGVVGAHHGDGAVPQILGPSRKIPPKRGSASGHVPFQRLGRSVWFESTLERDFLRALKPFDGLVGVLEQPVPLNCKQLGFRKGCYRPDFLVWVRMPMENPPKPVLVEVKYEEDLEAKWSTIRPKLMAARRFARWQGWRFLLMTPRHLRLTCDPPHLTAGELPSQSNLIQPQAVLERLFGGAFARNLG